MGHDHTQISLASLWKLKTHISLRRWYSLWSQHLMVGKKYEITSGGGWVSNVHEQHLYSFFMNEKWNYNFPFFIFFHFHLVRSKMVKRSLSGSLGFYNLEINRFRRILKGAQHCPIRRWITCRRILFFLYNFTHVTRCE